MKIAIVGYFVYAFRMRWFLLEIFKNNNIDIGITWEKLQID